MFSSFSSVPKNELLKWLLKRDILGEFWSSNVVVKGPSCLSMKAGQLLLSSNMIIGDI